MATAQKPEVERIEPPDWWTGMKNPDLQLLVHGRNISSATVSVAAKGVVLRSTGKTSNPNYLFLNLRITAEAVPGKVIIIFKGPGGQALEYPYRLNARKTGSAGRKGFNTGDVIYLAMPDRFCNGDTTNDNAEGMLQRADRSDPSGRHGGDLKGVRSKLDYLSDLGVTALWLTPFQENNMRKFSYHGYAITDFYKADARLGTNRDYADLVEACHARGMKVVMDMICNHCGGEHWWMKDLPSADWVHQFPSFTRTNYRAATIVDPHAAEIDRNLMLEGWFDTTMPDLNQHNPFLAKYLIQNSIWWVETAGLDGIRMDTEPYPYKDFMSEWARAVLHEYPNFSIVGEAWLNKASLVSYWQKDARNHDRFNSYLTSVFDFPLYFAMQKAFNEKDGFEEGMARLYDILTEDFLYPDPDRLVVFCDNHDGDRFASMIGGDLSRFKLAMAFLLTVRGIPEIYYGTEILMDGLAATGHGFIRKDFPGGWPGDDRDSFTQEGRTPKQNSAFDYLQNLLKWRKSNEAVIKGNMKQFVPEKNVYTFFRYTGKATVMVVLNNGDTEASLDPTRFAECLHGFSEGRDVIFGKTLNLHQNLVVPGKTALVMELVR